jgi:hypothetical protein
MIDEGKYRFRTFTLEIKRRPMVPNSCLVIFSGGQDVDMSGYETSAGDRKKFEGDLKFMWNPLDAPSNKKGEYVVKFNTEEKLTKFGSWLKDQIKQYGGVIDK